MANAVATLKSGDQIIRNPDALAQDLANAFSDKGYNIPALERLLRYQGRTKLLEALIGHFIMRAPYEATSTALSQALVSSLRRPPLLIYDGSPEELQEIDASIARSSDRSGYRDRIGRGAARFFSLEGFKIRGKKLSNTPLAVLGAGAAGLLISRTLVNAGFRNVQIFDALGQTGGLWQQKNVRQGSKNNPFPFLYESLQVEAAPGEGASITEFLDDLASHRYGWQALNLHKYRVLKVVSGDLHHRIFLRDGQGNELERDFPIVINALGIGKPLPPSREGVMTTDTPQNAGIRWQQILTPAQAEKLRGKTLVFIGLGNSTAEMLLQVQRFNRAGYNIHYIVLTHYLEDSLNYPRSSQLFRGKEYRLFRDLQTPQLTKLAGDLEHINTAFRKARDRSDELGTIVSEVEHWSAKEENDKKTIYVRRSDGGTVSFNYDQIYTLIGYGHPKEQLLDWGMSVRDDYLGTIYYDYDGEIQRHPGALGRRRVYPGHFGFGSLLKSAENPNAQVIPGMLFRLPDTFAGIVLRAIEHAYTR